MKEMTSKEVVLIEPTSHNIECCMCGDYGLLCELFQCSVCIFRSQHKYCSNLYPKAQSYEVCNWCLKKEETKTEETHSFSFSSSSCNESNSNEDEDKKRKNYRRSTSKLHLNNPIEKQRSQDRSQLRKKINASDVFTKESSLARKKSKKISNTKMAKQVFRCKVQRYKLLEEVCG